MALQNIEARIEGLNEYGEGYFPLRNHIVKVGRTVPGDLVKVRLPAMVKRFVRAEAMELLEASPQRVALQICPHFSDHASPFLPGCGGCQWLHVNYPTQLKAKARIVNDLLRRQGIKVVVQPVIGMENPQAYRNKMSLINSGGRLSFKKEYSDEAVFPLTCVQETLENQAIWEKLRDLPMPPELLQLHLRSVTAQVGVLLFVKQYTSAVETLAATIKGLDNRISGVAAASYRDYRLLQGSDNLEIELGNVSYGIPLNGFFQTNYHQALVLRDLAIARLELCPSDRVLDLFCGSGFFSLPIAKKVDSVLAVENNRESIQAAIKNAQRNRIGNARFVSADAAKSLQGQNANAFTVTLVDPPRSGCGPELLAQLIRLRPMRIVYVSCSPESLASDLAVLCKSDYKVIECQPVDMFPHTFHVETVVTLIKTGS